MDLQCDAREQICMQLEEEVVFLINELELIVPGKLEPDMAEVAPYVVKLEAKP